jgi:hypothetical protein
METKGILNLEQELKAINDITEQTMQMKRGTEMLASI